MSRAFLFFECKNATNKNVLAKVEVQNGCMFNSCRRNLCFNLCFYFLLVFLITYSQSCVHVIQSLPEMHTTLIRKIVMMIQVVILIDVLFGQTAEDRYRTYIRVCLCLKTRLCLPQTLLVYRAQFNSKLI
jgi:hypothetical protein